MNVMSTVNFVARNPMFCIKNVRDLPAVIKAMNEYRKAFPKCAWCGRPKVEVHHIRPVKLFPELAAEPSNFISLGRKPNCHCIVGHFGDWKLGYNLNVVEVCKEVNSI